MSITWSPWLCSMAGSGDFRLVNAFPCLSILLPPKIKAGCVLTPPCTNKCSALDGSGDVFVHVCLEKSGFFYLIVHLSFKKMLVEIL